jgi:23S rRNA (adenine2030-N6)-methyltransferase
MNYRHAFHAGNVGDVLKHVVLVALLDRLLAKPAPLLFMDTHAGRGRYDLESTEAARGGEWQDGIGRLWNCGETAPEIARYLELVRSANGSGSRLQSYPGSPLLALAVLRKEDRKVFVEKHPEEAAQLRAATRGRRNLSVLEQDGYATLKGTLPPKENRGLVLLDPPFEATSEFADLATALKAGCGRWPNGLFAAWYPLKAGADAHLLHRSLEMSGVRKILLLELSTRPADSPTGLVGSGMLLINPPWQFDTRMRELLPILHGRLSPEGTGSTRVEWLVPE